MGGQKYYKAEGGFVQYLYHQVGIVTADNGISAKVVEKINKEDHAQGLPAYSNTSDIYLKKGKESGDIIQARIYKDRKAYIDFDWSHNHQDCPEGVVHVHFYKIVDGVPRKQTAWRYMNNEEMKKYGPLLRKATPNVKFRK